MVLTTPFITLIFDRSLIALFQDVPFHGSTRKWTKHTYVHSFKFLLSFISLFPKDKVILRTQSNLATIFFLGKMAKLALNSRKTKGDSEINKKQTKDKQ